MKTDGELLQAISRKDQSAYTEFYKRYYADFIRIITFRLGNIDDAKDFSQDFWLFLFSNPESVLTDENACATRFLHNLLSLRIIDRLRTMYRNATIPLEENSSEVLQVCTQEATAEQQLAVYEIEEIIDKVVQKLSELDRQVYHLRQNKGYSVEETARELSISPKTVRNKLSLILSSVRTELKSRNYSCDNQRTIILILITGLLK